MFKKSLKNLLYHMNIVFLTDDCKNIVSILSALVSKGFVLDETSQN